MDDGTVDRNAETSENAEVDRTAGTVDPDEVDRIGSTQEDDEEYPAIIMHIHPVLEDKSSLLHGFTKKLESKIMSFQVNKELMFGRGENVTILFNDPTASREHMTIKALLTPSSQDNRQELQFMVKILKLMKVNGKDVNKGEERILKSRDVLQIGQNTFTVEIHPHNVYKTDRYLLEVRLMETAVQSQPQPSGLPYNSCINPAMQQMPSGGVIPPVPAFSQQFMSFPQQNSVLMQQQVVQMHGMQSAPFSHPGVFPLQQPGMPAQMQQPGMPAQMQQAGMPAQMQQPGMPAQIQQAGMPAQMQQPGMPAQMQQPGMPAQMQIPNMLPQQGMAACPQGMPFHFSQMQQQQPYNMPVSIPGQQLQQQGQHNANHFYGFHSQIAQQRRDAYAGQMPCENEERPHNMSIEETHPPDLSKGTSFEDTHPPKQ